MENLVFSGDQESADWLIHEAAFADIRKRRRAAGVVAVGDHRFENRMG